MKIKAERLISHIEKARVGGLVDEMVLDEKLSFQVSDDAKSVLAISNLGLGESGFGSIGIFDLSLFVKAIQFAATQIFSANEDLDFTVDGSYLVFKKKGKSEFKFLLSNPEVICNSVKNLDDVLARIQSHKAIKVEMKKDDFDVVSKAIELITPEKVTMYTEDGKVYVLIGNTKQHNSIICLGKTDSGVEVNLDFVPGVFTKLIQVLPFESGVTMELRKDMPAVFSAEYYTFLMAPVKEQ